jgi:hypothetical protein
MLIPQVHALIGRVNPFLRHTVVRTSKYKAVGNMEAIEDIGTHCWSF